MRSFLEIGRLQFAKVAESFFHDFLSCIDELIEQVLSFSAADVDQEEPRRREAEERKEEG